MGYCQSDVNICRGHRGPSCRLMQSLGSVEDPRTTLTLGPQCKQPVAPALRTGSGLCQEDLSCAESKAYQRNGMKRFSWCRVCYASSTALPKQRHAQQTAARQALCQSQLNEFSKLDSQGYGVTWHASHSMVSHTRNMPSACICQTSDGYAVYREAFINIYVIHELSFSFAKLYTPE